jgi:hypothetical protein
MICAQSARNQALPGVETKAEARDRAMSRVFRRAREHDEEQMAVFDDLVRGGRDSRKRQTAPYSGKLADVEARDRNKQLQQRYGLSDSRTERG